VELVANGIRGGTAGTKGSATGSGADGADFDAFGLLFFLVPFFCEGFIMGKAASEARQHKQHKARRSHSQSGKYEPEEPE